MSESKVPERCVVITQPGLAWRVSISPPGDGAPDLPASADFDIAEEALTHAALLAQDNGWSLIDMTGLRSPEELRNAVRRAGISGLKVHDTAA